MIVTTRLYDLPTRIKGFVRKNSDETYTIVINSRISYESQLECYKHEMGHIENGDFDKDIPVDEIEAEAHRRDRK